MRRAAVTVATISAALIAACGSSTSSSTGAVGTGGGTNQSSASSSQNSGGSGTVTDLCLLFTKADAEAILGKPVMAQARNGLDHCGYDVLTAQGSVAAASLSVTTRLARIDLRQAAATLHLTMEVSGVGDLAFTDGRLTLLARKGNIEIQVVFVNFNAVTVDATAAMTAAAKKVADGL